MHMQEEATMEDRKDTTVRTDLPEWEKPSIRELDINATTLSGYTGIGADNSVYS